MRLQSSFLIAVLLLGACSRKPAETSVFIDPQFGALVPPDTTLLVGLRVEHLVKTPLYQKYLSGGKIRIIDKFARGTGSIRRRVCGTCCWSRMDGIASCWGAGNLRMS